MPVDLYADWPETKLGDGMAVIGERRRYIDDTAPCVGCGATRRFCDVLRETNTDPTAPPWFGCCAMGTTMSPCRHVADKRMVDQLMHEIMAGEVRTVAEAYPPPMQGPKLPSHGWLLNQADWWYPHRRPAVRIAEMDKPWRWNTVRYLERKAKALHLAVTSGYMYDAPDDVWASWEAEDPAEWLREQPLMKALTKGLPPVDSKAGRLMAARAIHWNTCPMRRKHPAPADTCMCVRDGGGRIIGATNDPASPAVTA